MQFGIWLVTALTMAFGAMPAGAQRRHPNERGNEKQERAQKLPAGKGTRAGKTPAQDESGNGAEQKGQRGGRNLMGLPPKWVEHLQELSPEEQERFMRNNARFQSLPPERQQQIRQRLEKWNRLSPGERNVLRDRWRVLEQMTPEQRERIQNHLLPKWRELRPERQQLLLGRLRTLRGLSDSEREARLNDPQFMHGLSPDEQGMLRDLNTLGSPPTPE